MSGQETHMPSPVEPYFEDNSTFEHKAARKQKQRKFQPSNKLSINYSTGLQSGLQSCFVTCCNTSRLSQFLLNRYSSRLELKKNLFAEYLKKL